MNLNLDGIHELTELFRHRWDLVILALVAERPRRRRELTQEVVDENGEHIADGVLSEALSRLRAEGLIVRMAPDSTHVYYRATPAALAKVDLIRRISEIVVAAREGAAGGQTGHSQPRPSVPPGQRPPPEAGPGDRRAPADRP